jgi:hypothetical protein
MDDELEKIYAELKDIRKIVGGILFLVGLMTFVYLVNVYG